MQKVLATIVVITLMFCHACASEKKTTSIR